MAYSCDIANILAEQLAKFVTLNRHQLASHVANLEFWLTEIEHCLTVLDGYGSRFQRLRSAQHHHVAEHHTTEFDLSDPCCTKSRPSPPRRVPEAVLKMARVSLCDSARQFLLRCFREKLIERTTLKDVCGRLDIGIEARDFRKYSP